ncbi:venom carboxylesterase-6-like [Penaeus japonicus]|uniref:venom carboxylesterase-6-like n=1 Tax=Penaeus japonicus TaxID=27405 RepID=UPI001C7166DB|nr:venom carboxylesterase-6-like [Penaeus japonicus]
MKIQVFLLATVCLAVSALTEESCSASQVTAEESCTAATMKRVQLQQGVIEGVRSEVGGGKIVYSFKSIPFAQPPVGELRFKDPQPAGAWTGVRNGSLPLPKCPQFGIGMFKGEEAVVEGEEDCLYLSVFTPRPFASDLPVMVWIHGGGFLFGGGEEYKPFPLLTKDVVVVIIQYRLGTLGFLSTEDSELRGNLGLKDQTVALQWVQDNIRDLGGDPGKVTIFGESAGGASVDFHVLSPMSKGLFTRAIMQSGTALCPWASRRGHRDVATKLVELLNCTSVSLSPSLDSSALLTCLRGVPFDQLVTVQLQFNVTLLRKGLYNKVDIISGVTAHEGALFSILHLTKPELPELLLKDFSVNGPLEAGFDQEDEGEYMTRRVYHHYLGSLQISEEKSEELTQLYTDRMFMVCHLDVVRHHQRDESFGNRVYAYELQHRGEHSFLDLFVEPSEVAKEWVSHGDDLQYLFEAFTENLTLSRSDDLLVARIVVDLWTNFAATGHPTPDLALGFRWEPTTQHRDAFLSITTSPDMKEFSNQGTQRFWNNMPTEANKLLDPARFSRCHG